MSFRSGFGFVDEDVVDVGFGDEFPEVPRDVGLCLVSEGR